MKEPVYFENPALLATRALRQNGYLLLSANYKTDWDGSHMYPIRDDEVPPWNFIVATTGGRIYHPIFMGLLKFYIPGLRAGYLTAEIDIGCKSYVGDDLGSKLKYWKALQTSHGDAWVLKTHDINHARKIYDILNKVIKDNEHNLPEGTFLACNHVRDVSPRIGNIDLGV